MKPHPFDAVSLAFGVIFSGIGALYLTGNDVGELVTRFWPGAVVLLGLAMLFSARRDEPEPVPAPLPGRPASWADPVAAPAPPAPVATPEPPAVASAAEAPAPKPAEATAASEAPTRVAAERVAPPTEVEQ
ncbi:MAG TPA: hypothetical protein VEU28_00015 [Actinomycetota bacterium]|nr:hypothetical protein [Actinomycetota bacterium]